MLKLLHCADIHLDSPFTAANAERAEVRRNELRAAFTSMLLYARTSDCKMILMAGDIVDEAFATRDTAAMLMREFANIPSVRIVIAPGNHDPYCKGSIWAATQFPPNVYIFDSENLSYFTFDDIGVDVYGYAFTSRDLEKCPFSGCRPLDMGKINLLCAHGDLTSPISKKCPITESDLISSGFTYAALGHIHNTTGIKKAVSPTGNVYYGYSGCLEGRDFGECGYKGAIVVEIDEDTREVNTKGVRFSKRRYEILNLDATGMQDAAEAVEAYKRESAARTFGSDTMVRLVLEGAVVPGFSASASDFGELTEFVDNTSPTYDDAYLRSDPGIRGAFYRELLPMLTSDNPEERKTAREALRIGMKELSNK